MKTVGHFVLHFVVRLIRKSMHIYKETKSLSQSHKQLQNNNTHIIIIIIIIIIILIFSLWQMQSLSISG